MEEEVERSTQVSFVSEASRKNAHYQRYMEDRHTIIPCLDNDANIFYASVFDGHGGSEMATYASQQLHNNIISALHCSDLTSTEQCLEYAYYYTDIQSAEENVGNSGSTGVTILIMNEDGKRVVYSANAGDSRSILYSNGTTKRLSYDHKASDEEEENRIKEVGGFIINKRVIGILAISRSFGDHSYKRYITAHPFVQRVELDESSEFIVLASDGVYDALSDEAVSNLVKKEIESGNTSGCAEKLVCEAIEYGSTDNITAIVIGIKPVCVLSVYYKQLKCLQMIE